MGLDGESAGFADEGGEVGSDVAVGFGGDVEQGGGGEGVRDGGGEDLKDVQTRGGVGDAWIDPSKLRGQRRDEESRKGGKENK